MNPYLKQTTLLDFGHPSLTGLVAGRRWGTLPAYERIAGAYDFLQNGIAFGYNAADDIAASQVLEDGYGQCNTKSTLLMALLRGCLVPCRFHAFGIDKQLQPIEWQGADTFIQKEGITLDYGVFDCPDDFYDQYGANLGGLKRFLFRHIVRKRMNRNVARIREGRR